MKCAQCGADLPERRNPVPTVDIIIEVVVGVVLMERKNPPYGWALPGGFVDYGESYEKAARREAHEETGLLLHELRQFHTYSNPGRDPRMHTASTVFTAKASGRPSGGDDASRAEIFTRENLPELVFDHGKILADYFAAKEKKIRK